MKKGAMPEVLKELKQVYGRTNIINMVTTDAGNTSLKTSGQIVDNGWNYFSQIKEEHGQLYKKAESTLSTKTEIDADGFYNDQQKGKAVLYYVWQYDLAEMGYRKWRHARQLIRVERIVIDEKTGEQTVGNRYYVCNLTTNQLSAENCLKFSRAYWRCEEETHWIADVIFSEDQRRLTWSRHPNGVFIVAILRILALDIISIARKLSRIGYSSEKPSWKQVIENFFLNLCGSILITTEFDADI
jgi:predicted transposase YbfD/YdcC